jgi:aryl-alcohol dehydrogenase-like predicted oxidoreductase
MEYFFLGATGLKVSSLCLGTMTFGAAPGGAPATTQCSEEEAHRILDAFVAAGGNFIDTADVYQKGESERVVGACACALRGRGEGACCIAPTHSAPHATRRAL